jgi:hypothetical protein
MASDASERETCITWTDADKGIAQVYTCQRRILTKLRKNPSATRVEVFKDDSGHITGEQWEIPVKLISFRSSGRSGRVLTPEQRSAIGKRLRHRGKTTELSHPGSDQ